MRVRIDNVIFEWRNNRPVASGALKHGDSNSDEVLMRGSFAELLVFIQEKEWTLVNGHELLHWLVALNGVGA